MVDNIKTAMERAEVTYPPPGQDPPTTPGPQPTGLPPAKIGCKHANVLGQLLADLKKLADVAADRNDPLADVIFCKEAEALIADLATRVKPEANARYNELIARKGDRKPMKLWNATFQTYTPRASYVYPVEIINLEIKVKAMKTAAEANGTAIKEAAAPITENSTLFSVKLD